MIEWQPVILSIEVAAASLFVVLISGVSSAYFMRRFEFTGKAVIESFMIMPLVLPPVVTGFLLLLLIGKQGMIGHFLSEYLHTQIIFTPYAAILAGSVVAFPLMYQNAKAALLSVDPKFEDAAKTLGASEWRVFWTISLPLAWQGVVSGMVLAFSRALGEFGATIMVAGNIPGKTQTIPLAIYFASEASDLMTAGAYVLLISLVTFLIVYLLNVSTKAKSVLVKGDFRA
ncbi:ABC transporter permease [Anaerosporomusa subterranea]|uniref:Molybdenum transport system permease n=1 Tax=Anaerosporomusa subterranea TaxID=1794912 RepID=A0A154BVL6_ANASB|nr:molybdate ABC transporter permease subunit [Anaerosporomusa subterranea]KYZ78074.1 ABC transporter permease [Anaerosporomusa subterranea]